MTGRDLIVYILKNNLEDEDIFKDGKLVGYITADEVAKTFDVGMETVKVWIDQGMIDGVIKLNSRFLIPENWLEGRRT